MTTYYADTSALVKRYVDEAGEHLASSGICTRPPPTIVIVHLATVEVTDAFTRRLREGVLTPAEHVRLQNNFRADCLNAYEMVNGRSTPPGTTVPRSLEPPFHAPWNHRSTPPGTTVPHPPDRPITRR